MLFKPNLLEFALSAAEVLVLVVEPEPNLMVVL